MLNSHCILSHLEHSRRESSLGGLTVLAKNRKKQHLVNVLKSLGTIKTLVSCIHCSMENTEFGYKLKEIVIDEI